MCVCVCVCVCICFGFYQRTVAGARLAAIYLRAPGAFIPLSLTQKAKCAQDAQQR